MKKLKEFPATLIPAFFWFVIFLIFPLVISIVLSLLHKGAYGKIVFSLDFSNYARVFDSVYFKIIMRSFILATFTTLTCLILSMPICYYMTRSSENTKPILLGLIVVPFWSNFVIRVYALKLILGQDGWINSFLLHLHIISTPLQLVDNLTGVALGMIYNYLPFMIIPLFVAMERFDFLLFDAAYDLGASKIRVLFKVLIPLILPGIITGSLFVFIPSFGEFVIPDLLGGAQNMYIGNLITETFLKSRDWPFGSALSSTLVALTVIAFIFSIRHQGERQHVH